MEIFQRNGFIYTRLDEVTIFLSMFVIKRKVDFVSQNAYFPL
ncbi:hypothetical protein RV07_GL004050 [Enterococcus malodoratus]|nr:hypothetical protein RV07_GL004050 [Enterococcus malodoratus]